jgi:hypothetical protein
VTAADQVIKPATAAAVAGIAAMASYRNPVARHLEGVEETPHGVAGCQWDRERSLQPSRITQHTAGMVAWTF